MFDLKSIKKKINNVNLNNMDILEIADDVKSKNLVTEDCMMCFKCVEACPEEKCLDVRFLGLPVYRSTEEGFFKRGGKG